MIFVCTYLQSNHFVSVKDMRNLQQILNTEVVKNTTNPGMRMAENRKIHKFPSVDWSTTAEAQNPRVLKNADINRFAAVMTGQLRESTQLKFPWTT